MTPNTALSLALVDMVTVGRVEERDIFPFLSFLSSVLPVTETIIPGAISSGISPENFTSWAPVKDP